MAGAMAKLLFRLVSSTAILFPGILALAACRSEAPVENMENAVANNMAEAVPPKAVIAPEPALDREALLLAAVRARSAAATGTDDREAQAALDRRRFEFRIRIGCNIFAPGAPESAEARYDAEGRRVLLRVAPDVSADRAAVAGIAGEGVEAVEGFWVPRPWLLTPSCAGAAPGASQIGLAQFFTAQDSRTARRDGRAYEIAAPLPEGATAPAAGSWDLVLRGRLRKWGGDRVIVCRPASEGAVPACLISVQFDDVSIEETGSGRSLGNWGRG
jgi:hypothetical protein